jgi:predicted cupin superfamily sugar epimerase
VTAAEVIRLLELVPLPVEGGYFRETWRSPESLDAAVLPPRFPASRSLATSIFYLLTSDTFSALHRLRSDEIFHFYLGDPVEMLQLFSDGAARRRILGPDLAGGQSPQVVVPHGTWQGSRLLEGGAFALLGTTVSPGFDYGDYETGELESLVREYPDEADAIRRLIRA